MTTERTDGEVAVPRDHRWLRTPSAAIYLGVHQNTLYRIPREELPYMAVGTQKHRRYLQSDLDAYIHRVTRGE
jgi:excisionase family DNA binding protein